MTITSKPSHAMSFNLRHVEIFHAIMTTGSVTEAAILLHSSQPTISRELARLEQLSGLTLFERVRGRLRPTRQALQLFEEVQRAYLGLERIVSTAEALRHFDHGQLSIACLPMFSQAVLPTVCQRFLARYPKVRLSIAPQESPLLEEWLAAQRHDLGLTESQLQPAGTSQQQIFCADEVAVLPSGHPLCHKAVLELADFAGQAFISLSVSDIYRQQLDSLFAEQQVQRQMVLETHSAASVCSMVRQGVGIAVVNPLTALEFAGQGVVVRKLAVSLPFRVHLVRPLHRPASALVDSFDLLLQEVLQEASQRTACLV
ncbi:LysR family transcriptional regulator [Aquitalea sp. FJL05]|uniref:LysR family transcriptional regulator n=2 Tax=Aquitalea TaxID=407217 RepID=UPI000F5B665F|nr:LysR family transcriptional regulator [Aquitalea sp. FJL05]RQO76362.1 LysR family transcriptional regulator [Aquitalea sp. FJL05]